MHRQIHCPASDLHVYLFAQTESLCHSKEPAPVDLYHRRPQHTDSRNGRECGFCAKMDPNFNSRRTIDRMVVHKQDDTASAHLTEDGYVRHRIAELMKKRAMTFP